MAGSRTVSAAMLCCLLLACDRTERTGEPVRMEGPTVIVRQKPAAMTEEHRRSLGIPEEVLRAAEAAAEVVAEPFFEDVLMRTANLRGDVMLSGRRLAGFSVRTDKADEVIASLSPSFRKRGYLIFRSEQNYGRVPDIVTVVRGGNSYDILKVQKTEGPSYHLDTAAIIKWLREQQKLGSFVVTGAGADWVEARFVAPPRDMRSFARKVAAFAPDVLSEGSIDQLARRMERMNGFSLWWD